MVGIIIYTTVPSKLVFKIPQGPGQDFTFDMTGKTGLIDQTVSIIFYVLHKVRFLNFACLLTSVTSAFTAFASQEQNLPHCLWSFHCIVQLTSFCSPHILATRTYISYRYPALMCIARSSARGNAINREWISLTDWSHCWWSGEQLLGSGKLFPE